MAYSRDEEERKRRAAARKESAAGYSEKRAELLAQNKKNNAASATTKTTEPSAAPSKQAVTRSNPAEYASSTRLHPTEKSGSSAKASQIVSAAKAGGLTTSTGYQKKNFGDNDMIVAQYGKQQQTFDLASMTYEQAMGVAVRIVDDKERDSFLKAARKQFSNERNENYMENVPTLEEMRAQLNAQKPGGVYQDYGKKYSKGIQEQFARDYKNTQNMKTLSGLYDVNGNAINANTADFATVVQGIRSIADETKRKNAIASLKELIKTEGSRFYGQTIDEKLLGTYLGSPEFTQTNYNSFVKTFEDKFYPQSGHEEQNKAAYDAYYTAIQNTPYSDSVKRQLLEKLDEVYQSSTLQGVPQKDAPQPDTQGVAQTEEKAEENAGDAQGETLADKLAKSLAGAGEWWNELTDGDAQLPGALGELADKIKAPYSNEDTPQNGETATDGQTPAGNKTPRTAPFLRQQEQDTQDIDWRNISMDGATRLASAGRSDSESPIPAKESKEVQGPVQQHYNRMSFDEWMQAGMPVYGARDDSDVVGAIRKGYLDQLPQEHTEAVLDMLEYRTAQQVIGTVMDENALAEVRTGNRGAENVVRESMGMLGKTASNALNVIMGDDFPEDLQNDGILIMMELAAKAEQMAQNGTLGGDESLPLLERLLTTDTAAKAELQGIFDARDLLEADRTRMAEENARATEQTLAEAREAVRKGEYSEAQLAMVKQYAPEVTHKDLIGDVTRREMAGYIADYDGGYFAEGGGYESSAVRRNLNSNGVVDDLDYRVALNGQMIAIVDEDTRYAMSLGMTLKDYYNAIGGMTADDICQRAATRMTQQGNSMTEEEAAMLAEYGGGVGAVATTVHGISKGTAYFFGSYADSLYMGLTEANVVRTAGEMQVYYQDEFGAFGRTMYRRDMEKLIESGELDESYATALKRAMAEAPDVYSIGVDPQAMGGLRAVGADLRKTQERLDRYMRENGTEGENKAYGYIASMTSNGWMAATSYAAKKLTGGLMGGVGANAKTIKAVAGNAGFLAGYDIPGWGEQFAGYLDKGYKRGSASALASISTLGSHMANIATFEKITDQVHKLTGMKAVSDAALCKAVNANATGAMKGLAAVHAYTAGRFGAALVTNTLDEALGDNAKEGIVQSYIDNAIAPVFRKSDSGAEIGLSDMIGAALNIAAIDFIEVGKDVAAQFVDSAITSSLFSLVGAAGAATEGYNSVKLAQDIVSGKSSDVSAWLEATGYDLQNPVFCDVINAAARNARKDAAFVEEMLTDDGADGMMDAEAAAEEQAQAHADAAAAAEAGMQRAEETMTAMEAKMAEGVLDASEEQMLTDAQEAYPKDRTTFEEKQREELEKREEAKQIRAEKTAKARTAAAQRIAREDQELIAQMAEMAPGIYESGMQSTKSRIERKKEELLAQIEAEFGKPEAEQDENVLTQLNAQYAMLEDMQAEMDAEEAMDAEAIRTETERKLTEIAEAKEAHVSAEVQRLTETRETLASLTAKEKDLDGVYKSLRNDFIYVDDQELSQILYETGAKSLTEVNRMLGTKLTRDKAKGKSLTGGYYDELKQMAPGYFRETWDSHPEEAVVSLMKERKVLRQDIEETKQAEREATEAYRKKAADRYKPVTEAAQNIPEGYALSQFENETAQESDAIADEAKEAIAGTVHEVHHDKDVVLQATRRIAQNGLDNTVNELLGKDGLDDADIATAHQALKILKQNGNIIRSTMLSAKIGMSLTKTGRALRMANNFKRNAAQTCAADAIAMADKYNKKHGKYKSVNMATGFGDMQQMSLGETKYQPFMENKVSRATSDPAMQQLASDVKQRSGLDVYWADMPDGMRGFFDRKRGVIVLNQKIGAAQGMYVTAIHEFTHFMEQTPQYKAYAESILKAAYGENYADSNARRLDEGQIRSDYAKRNAELDDDRLNAEIVAAATERILLGDEAFMRTLFGRGNGGVAVKILSGMDSFMRKQKAKQEGKESVERYELIEAAREKMKSAIASSGKWKAESGQDGAGAQYALVNPGSHYDYSKPFAEQVEDWKAGRIREGDTLIMGGTPEVLRNIGFNNLPLTFDQKHLREMLIDYKNEDHHIDLDVIKRLPELIADPVAIIEADTKNRNDSILIILGEKNRNAAGRQIVGAINVQNGGQQNGRSINATRLITAHSRGDLQQLVKDAVSKENAGVDAGVYYVNKNAVSDMRQNNYKELLLLKQDGYIHSIHDSSSPVNARKIEQNKSEQFVNWFKGSTIKNPDGTPKVMYRGGGEDIAVFDRKKSKSSNLYGRGFYFTAEENQAAAYGEVRPYYLSVKHPLTANGKRKITESQMRAFLEAVAEDEDYGLENYGYGATVDSVLKSLKGKDDFAALQDINATTIGDFVAAVELFNKVNGTDYDGIITPTETVVFQSEQIKSADKNIGLFDPKNKNVYYSIQTERNVQAAQTQLGRQQAMGEEQMPPVTDDVAMQPQPDGEQVIMRDPDDDVNEVTARVLANIAAMNTAEDVNTDNEWGLPLNDFQREQIKRFKLSGVKLPGLAYNRATIEQRMLCAILATPQDYRGEGLMTLTQQLEALEQNKNLFGQKVAVVTDADLYYITSQGAIVAASDVDEAGIPLEREADQAYARMLDAQANIVPVSMGEKMNAWRYMSMLSSPVTAVKNVGANVIMSKAERVSTAGAAFFDKLAAKKTGNRQVGMATGEERNAGKEAGKKRLRDAYDDYFVAKTNTSRSRRYDTGDGRVFENEALETVRNMIAFAMDAPDQMAMEQTITEELAVMERLGTKIRDEDTGKMREMTEGERYVEALRRAEQRFFHENNAMIKLMNEIYKIPGIGTAARVLVPFSKTPTNVALRMMEYSPIGLLKSVVYDGLYNMNRDGRAHFDQYRFAMGMGRGMTGTMVTALGILLYQAGILVGGRDEEENDKRREVKSNLGEPYSLYIQLGDTKHEIAFTMPSLAGFAIGAGIAQRWNDEESLADIALGMISDGGNALFDNSYLSTLNDVFSGYGTGWEKVESAFASYGESWIQQTFSPAVFRAIAKTMDPYARDTSSKSTIVQTINENIVQNWPFLRQMLPKKYDLTGNEMTQHKAYQPGSEWQNAAMNFVDGMLSPTATYTEKDDAALSELLDLSYRLERDGADTPMSVLPTYLINSKSYSLDVNKSTAQKLGHDNGAMSIELTEDEKREVNREYSSLLFNGSGTTMYQDIDGSLVEVRGLRKIMDGYEYQHMTDEQRQKEIEDEMKLVKRLMQTKVVRQKEKDGELR